jgi:SsrA-binding protein
MAERSHTILASNRKARHFYTILETLEAGIALTGTEIKSLRGGNANLQDSYAMIERGELWLHGMHIGPYEHGSISNHDPRRTRKLLVTRKELRKLRTRVQEKGLALVPLSVYVKGRFAKVELAIAQGRKSFDRRQAIAERDAKREIEQRLKRSRD